MLKKSLHNIFETSFFSCFVVTTFLMADNSSYILYVHVSMSYCMLAYADLDLEGPVFLELSGLN
jgi:hypothetical protein